MQKFEQISLIIHKNLQFRAFFSHCLACISTIDGSRLQRNGVQRPKRTRKLQSALRRSPEVAVCFLNGVARARRTIM